MNAPVRTYTHVIGEPKGFAELSSVRLLRTVTTDDGEEVAVGMVGVVVGVWAHGVAYEVEFKSGVATVEAELLTDI